MSNTNCNINQGGCSQSLLQIDVTRSGCRENSAHAKQTLSTMSL